METALNTSQVFTLQDKIRGKMEDSFHRRAFIKKNKLSDNLSLEKALEEDVFKIGHIMLDLHEEFNVPLRYELLSEFDKFKTPLDIVKYIEENCPEKEKNK